MPRPGRPRITPRTKGRGDQLRTELKRAREKKDWTQQDLATTLEMSTVTLSAIESGKSVDPSFFKIRDIAEALGIPPGRLFEITR